MLTVTLGLRFQKFSKVSKSKHTSFLEPVNLEFRLAVFNFLPILSLICS